MTSPKPDGFKATVERIRVCHLVSGDTWAGAEVQVGMLLPRLLERAELDVSAILLNHGPLERELRDKSVPVVVLDESRFSAWRIFRALRAEFKTSSPNILHTHGYKEHFLGSLAGKTAGVRHVVKTVHGLTEPYGGLARLKMSLYVILDKIIDKLFTDRIIAVSHQIRKKLERGAGTPVVTIHNGVDLERTQPTASRDAVCGALGIAPRNPIVGTVGRMVPVKGFDLLLKAARAILNENPKVTFLLVGDGASRKELEDLSRHFRMEKNVIFTGQRTDVYDLISAMDVFLISSLHEGIPTVLLEAMTLETPVVATAVGGIPEVIDEDAGCLVRSRDDRQLAREVLRLLSDQDHARGLVERAKQRVEKAFTTQRQAENVHATYDEVMNDSRS